MCLADMYVSGKSLIKCGRAIAKAYQRAIVFHKLLSIRDISHDEVVREYFANEHHNKANHYPTQVAPELIEAVHIRARPTVII